MRIDPRRTRPGFTMSQLLVLLALLLLLAGFMLSAVFRVRMAAGNAQSQNNLRQIVLATIKTADDYQGAMPPGSEDWFPTAEKKNSVSYGSCLFHILPNMEQARLWDATKDGKNEDPAMGWRAAGKPIKTFQGPGDPTVDPASDRSSYIGNALIFSQENGNRNRFPASFTDGTSQTIFYAEAYSEARETTNFGGDKSKGEWTVERHFWESPVWTPSELMFQVLPPRHAASPRCPQGLTSGGIIVGIGDGSVRFVSSKISASTFAAACTIDAGDILGNDW